MKKILLTLGIACFGLTVTSYAQLALQNFNSSTLPANWVLINDGHTVSTSFTNVTAIQTGLTANAWIPYQVNGQGDYSMITTSDFNPTATADRWLITPSFMVTSANMVIQWGDYDLGSGESIQVLVSPTAGTTAGSFTTTLYNAPAGVNDLTTHQLPIGAYNGQTIRLAFRDNTANNWGLILDNVSTAVLSSLDLGVTSVNLPPFAQTGSSNNISGVFHNYGLTTVTSANLNYSVNGGAPVTTSLTGLNVALGDDYNYASSTPWVPATAGTYVIKVWADNINGSGVDENHANDTMTNTVYILDALQPKTVMIEEFNQASCDPCAEAAPNVDSVYANNLNNSILLRYHVNFPGRDCMDSVTLGSFVSAQLSYYQVNGVPDAQVDGAYVYPGAAGPGTLSSSVLQAAAAVGSPFKITVAPTYNAATQTYSFTANVTCYAALPAGLKLRAALSIDDITYTANQSTESIPQYDFPEVAENMFPNAAGTTLGAFTAGSTQTITKSWVKNHPWGSDRAVWKYDSSNTGKIIVWVENDNTQYVYQAAYGVVTTRWSTGVDAVTSNNGSMNVYPNPAGKTATIALNLKTGADVKMEVMNTLGQVVYSMPVENRSAGTSSSTIDVSNFAAGQYFVKISIGTEVLTKQLTVIK